MNPNIKSGLKYIFTLFLLLLILLTSLIPVWLYSKNWDYEDFQRVKLGNSKKEIVNSLQIKKYTLLTGDELKEWKSVNTTDYPKSHDYIEPEIADRIFELWRIPRSRIFYGEYLLLGFDFNGLLSYKHLSEFAASYPATDKNPGFFTVLSISYLIGLIIISPLLFYIWKR